MFSESVFMTTGTPVDRISRLGGKKLFLKLKINLTDIKEKLILHGKQLRSTAQTASTGLNPNNPLLFPPQQYFWDKRSTNIMRILGQMYDAKTET